MDRVGDGTGDEAVIDEGDGSWRAYAARMVGDLKKRGALSDPQWSAALSAFPRHVFVPGAPWERAYSDAVVIQTKRAPDGTGRELATSSLSAPSAVAVAVEALALDGNERVLEIGTGTGYVAGLLSTRLGAHQVHTMDIDPELVAAATRRLAMLGLHPTAQAADGYDGLPEHAPYDRILATCSITHVPPHWIRQLAPEGRIVAPLDGDLDSPVVILDKTADDEVTGRFLLAGGGFMPLRATSSSPLSTDDIHDATAPRPIPSYSTTPLDPGRLVAPTPSLTLLCHLHLPGLHLLTRGGADSTGSTPEELIVRQHESIAIISAAQDDERRWPVSQSGPRRLWDTIETAVELHDHLNGPDPRRFGISALDQPHRQYAWLDDPDGPHCWPLT